MQLGVFPRAVVSILGGLGLASCYGSESVCELSGQIEVLQGAAVLSETLQS